MKSGSSSYSAEELKALYEKRFGQRTAYRNKVWRTLVRGFFQRYIRREDVVLDLGAGYGEFINHIQCAKKYAMDLNPDTPRMIESQVTLYAQDCASPWPLSNQTLDVVFTSNFFEHLPDQDALLRTLAEVKRCLKPGGLLIALGPNIRYTGDAYWEVEDHRLALSDLTLSDALKTAGFQITQCFDKFLPFTMAEGPEYPAFFVSTYLHLPLAWRVFGKQFLVIGKNV